MNETRFRRFDERDSVEELTALYHRAYADHAAAGRIFFASYQTVDDTRRRISKSECWLAISGERIIGTVTVSTPHHQPKDYPAPARAGSFSLLAVLPEHRRTGLGNQLLALTEKRIIESGLPAACFDTSSLATELIGWYERRGYRKIGNYKWDVTNYQSVVMSKTLIATDASNAT